MEIADGGKVKGARACGSLGGVWSTGAGGLRVERRCRPGLNPTNDRHHVDRCDCGTTTVVVKYGAATLDLNLVGERAEHHAPVNGPYDVFVGSVHAASSAVALSRRKPPTENLVEPNNRSSRAVQRACAL